MKVVLIAESEDTINEYTAFLEEAGADVITYRWFLKALDNLTEIQPHIIIVSAQDFPRHWKTLFTHIEAGEVKTQPLVYLITDPSFTASEKKKAMFLGAQDIFFSPLTNRDKNSLLSMLPAGMGIEPPAPKEAAPEPVEEEAASVEEPAIPAAPAPVSENSEYAALKEEAESQAVAENKIHNISAAEANAFDLIDSEISNLENEDDTPVSEVAEVTDESEEEAGESLVVESAEEDILTKLEDEMTEADEAAPAAEAEPVAEPEPEPEPVAEPEPEPITQPAYEEPAAPAFDTPEPMVQAAASFDDEPVPSAEPEPAPIADPIPEIERPEQITWSAPVDEPAPEEPVAEEPAPEPIPEPAAEEPEDETIDNGDPIQFSFINPRSGLVVTGSVENYDHPTIKFSPSSRESIDGIRFGQILDQCKFTFEGETVKARAQVRGLGQTIEFCLLY